MNENNEQIMFAHKLYIERLDRTYFTDVCFHPFTTDLYPNKTRTIYAVTVRDVKDGENSPYYGTLEDDGLFNFIYPSMAQTLICFPNDVRFKLHNLVLTEIGMLKPSEDYRTDLPKGWTLNNLMQILVK